MSKSTRIKKFSHRRSQHGVVLIVSLVFLIALTAVAAALMQNSTTDIKMSGASEEKVIAVQDALSAIDEVIFNQVGPNQNNIFTRPAQGTNFPVTDQALLLPSTSTASVARVELTNNIYRQTVDCSHAKLASSVGEFDCNVLRVIVTRQYGRTNNSQVQVSSSVAQVLIGNN